SYRFYCAARDNVGNAEEKLAVSEASTAVTWPIPADTNMDCVVNVLDLLEVRNRLQKDPEVDDNWQADVNEDGVINILDLITVRNELGAHCE
ncbi:MAG: hypothetical protein HQ592_14100, partial [Planctomycetes bacterium]|nr:hypothetical protein [Planctomycetota bacterium]